MSSSAPTLDEILDLAKSTDVLTEQQLARILHAAPQMTPADLEKLKLALVRIREMATAKRKKKIEVYKKVATAKHEWKAEKARTALNTEESASKEEENKTLDQLLTKL